MTWLKHISTLMLCISIAFAGVPAQAQPCPMNKIMHAQKIDMKGMTNCDQMTKQAPKKSGCCDEAACNANCAALGSGMTMNLPSVDAHFPKVTGELQLPVTADAVIASAHLSSQERPPKSLA